MHSLFVAFRCNYRATAVEFVEYSTVELHLDPRSSPDIFKSIVQRAA